MRKIGLLALVLVIALGSLGIGYALWWDTLYIDGTVDTGYIQADWSIEWVGDDEAEGKDVSSVVVDIDGDTLTVTIVNAYPSIDYAVLFDIHNSGTIPIHIGDIYMTSSNLPAGATVEIAGEQVHLPAVGGPWYDGVQVHPGELVWGVLKVHLDNDAAQDTVYSFTMEVNYWQYNEPGPTPLPDETPLPDSTPSPDETAIP